MSKFEESFGRRNAEALDMGVKNAEILQQAASWCKHFCSEMQSGGLLAQMSGLPIGLIEISCPYAEGASAGMNLAWIIPSFILENCAGCSHHEPNGDISWGEEIIDDHEKHIRSKQLQQEQLVIFRERLRELLRQERQNAALDEQQILIYVEELFSQHVEQREEAKNLLIQATRIGADLFPKTAIEILLEQALSEYFASLCFPICAKLAQHRKDLSEEFQATALSAIEKGFFLESASEILIHLGQEIVEYPLDEESIKRLIEQQIHYRPIGGWRNNPPSYSNTTMVLAFCYDVEPLHVVKPFQQLLQQKDESVRVNICGAFKLLQSVRPRIGFDLLPSLVSTLDEPYADGAVDAMIKECIAQILCYAPEQGDKYLISILYQKRLSVQEEIVDIYCRSAIKCHDNRRLEKGNDLEKIEVAEQVALRRCLEFIKDDFLNLDVRYKAAEALKHICYLCPNAAIHSFESLLGYYALICTQDDLPPETINIIIPSTVSNPQIDLLNSDNRNERWNHLKDKLLQTLQELVEADTKSTGEIVVRCYRNLDIRVHEKFKASLLKLLGYVGKEYSLRSEVLPLVMNGLMNFESQRIRSSAIHAVQEIYRYSSSNPPKNLVDILIVHLHDEYVVVHKAVIQTFRWHYGSWFNEEQAVEALQILFGWLHTYRNKPYDVDNIAEAIMRITYRFKQLKAPAIQALIKVFPTREPLVDRSLIDEMVRCIEPNSSVAVTVARQVGWYLSNYDRDRYNSYNNSPRARMFRWLHEIPGFIYQSIRSELIEFAKHLAERDAWEACYFASLFSLHEDFIAEKEILSLAISSLKQRKRDLKLREQLSVFEKLAVGNIYLQNGDPDKAYVSFLEVWEDEI